MVNHNLIAELSVDESAIDAQVGEALGGEGLEAMTKTIDQTVGHLEVGGILKGRIVNRIGNDVVIEVGLKSEGVISVHEFDDPSEIQLGEELELLLEAVEGDSGLVVLSKRKADRIRGWERIVETKKEGDTVSGKVTRKIKGGLLVDVGVPVFLPASQVDIRRPSDIGEYIGKTIDAQILKIDTERRNIVVSRRKMLEEQRAEAKSKLMNEIELGQVRKGTVKNIADFGAFVDLGGLDGLLHITDMSWGRINHPSEIVKIDQDIEIKVLNIDREKEKIALGLKQITPSPWEAVEATYNVGSKVHGEVVNLVSYGAFVKLEEGVEGLVHISEMSWTRRLNHPSELLQLGQDVEVVVLDVNKDKQEISLGIKQVEVNPWTLMKEKYPPATIVEGTVRNLSNYGAFVEIEEGIDGLLHVSDLSWTKKISHPSEVLKKGESIRCVVLSVDQDKMRVGLGLKQLQEDPWLRAVPESYIPGQIVKGTVTKVTNFGVFVELEQDLEGLLHVSEWSGEKIDTLEEVVKVGDDLEVKILRVDAEDRKIGLSKKRAEWASEGNMEDQVEPSSKPRRGGLHGSGEELGANIISFVKDEAQDDSQPLPSSEQASEQDNTDAAQSKEEGGSEN